MLDRIERELLLPATPHEVWGVVTSPGWLAEAVELELFPGGEAIFSSKDWSKTGWVEVAVAPDRGAAGRLAFWWAADGEPATRVELTLEPEGVQTRLRVTEARPLDLLDVVGIALPGPGGPRCGPATLVGV